MYCGEEVAAGLVGGYWADRQAGWEVALGQAGEEGHSVAVGN